MRALAYNKLRVNGAVVGGIIRGDNYLMLCDLEALSIDIIQHLSLGLKGCGIAVDLGIRYALSVAIACISKLCENSVASVHVVIAHNYSTRSGVAFVELGDKCCHLSVCSFVDIIEVGCNGNDNCAVRLALKLGVYSIALIFAAILVSLLGKQPISVIEAVKYFLIIYKRRTDSIIGNDLEAVLVGHSALDVGNNTVIGAFLKSNYISS